MIRWSTEMGCYQPPFSGGWNTSVSERPVDRAFESHQPHIFFTVSTEQDSLETQLLNNLGARIWKGAKMYQDILTMCWSIKEVNKNLSDRKQLTDYSIKYLKNACSELAEMIKQVSSSRPREQILVISKNGQKKPFALGELAEMLYDPRKIVELNLIDNVDRWARSKA